MIIDKEGNRRIRISLYVGTTIRGAVISAVSLAKKKHKDVSFKFNGIKLRATETSNASELVMEYIKQAQKINI